MRRFAEAVVVGAGLSGLNAARVLRKAGLHPLVLESGKCVGGRVRTDRLGGFQLDAGFQVLFEGYPEARSVLDYRALRLHRFYPGALVRVHGRFSRVADPFRKPWDILSTLASPVGTLQDKMHVARLAFQLAQRPLADILSGPEIPTMDWLRRQGFSSQMIERLFVPFVGGISLDRTLQTSSIMFEFVFKMMSFGRSALPSAGMGAIPDQMASGLPAESIEIGRTVTRVSPGQVELAGGEVIESRAIIVAVDGPNAARLIEGLPAPGSRPVWCFYLAADRSPVQEPILLLDGESSGPVNNLCVLSDVAPEYAPPGAALVSAAVLDGRGLGEEALWNAVRDQLASWFGPQVRRWRGLRAYRIEHAQPVNISMNLSAQKRSPRVGDGLYCCGDHLEMASIQGALISGRHAAEAVLRDLSLN